jgi:hypothetical protein
MTRDHEGNFRVSFQRKLHSLTGNIEFNGGKRSNFKLDLLKLKKEEIRKVGQWTPAGGVNITDPNAFYESHAPNITLVVMTREVSHLVNHRSCWKYRANLHPP